MNPRTQLAVAAAGVTLLGATSLHAVFSDTGWIAPVVGAVLAVLVGAEIGSRLGQHLAARPVWRLIGSVLGLLFYLTAVFAHQGAVLGFIPRGHTWHLLRQIFDKSFDEVHNLSTPAPTFRALMFLTALGVGLVAIAVDQLSIRPPLIGLALLALYSVPEWLSQHGTGWVPLVLGGAGFVALLIREGRDRTSRWGRTVTGTTTLGRNTTTAAAMSQAGWRIGVAAIAIALVVPPLVPDMGHFNLAKGGGRAAGSPVRYNTIAKLAGSLKQGPIEPQYSYHSSDNKGHYLRMATLSSYSVSKGQMQQGAQLPDPVDPTSDTLSPDGVGPDAGATALTTDIAIGPQLESPLLPVPIATTKLDGLQGRWAYQLSTEMIFSPDNTQDATKNQSFRATSDLIAPTADVLENSTLTGDDITALQSEATGPSDLPVRVRALALAVTKNDNTEFEKALDLQNYFRSGRFKYSLNGPTGSGYNPLVDFLFTSRRGFCQQFSTAMTLMARSLNIPARVAVGFTPGIRTSGSDNFFVDSHDFHAWPELYFHGIGWLRFEPTPRSDHQTEVPSYGSGTVAAIKARTPKGTKATTVPGGNGQIPRQIGPTPAERGSGNIGSAGSGGLSFSFSGRGIVLTLAGLAILLVLIGIPLGHALARRRRLRHGGDPRDVALLAWREMQRDALDLGYVTSTADSPRQGARRLTDAAALPPHAAAAIDRLARAVERARYAPLAGDPSGLLDDGETVRAAMAAHAPRRVRWRAKALPPSTISWTTGVLSRLGARIAAAVQRTADRGTATANRILRRRPSSV